MSYNEETLYKEWVADPTPEKLDAIVTELLPIINKAVSAWSSGIVPVRSLRVKGRQLAALAIQNYDENSTTKLSSWVHIYLKKLSRYAGSFNVLKTSEDGDAAYKKYRATVQSLTSELDGHTPTITQIADHMSIPESKVVKLEKTYSSTYQDSTLNTASYLAIDHVSDEDLIYAFRNLNIQEQKAVTMKTGWPDGRVHTMQEIGDELGMSNRAISKFLDEIALKMNRILRR